jgi:molybdate transport system ATP-binding protein
VLMDKGRVIGAGALDEMQSDPALPLAVARDAAVTLDGVIEARDDGYGLITLKVRGASLVAPAAEAAVGERRRVRVIAGDVSLTREAPGPSSILNVLPARIVSVKPIDSNEVVVVVALGADGTGARILSRVTRKSWEALRLAEGVSVYAQVKAVALAPGRGELG